MLSTCVIRAEVAALPLRKDGFVVLVDLGVRDFDALCQLAVDSGAITAEDFHLNNYPKEEFEAKQYSKPAGYCAQTRLHFGGLVVPMLLDYGATVSALPEEVACVIIQYALSKVRAGTLRKEDPVYPIVRLERYTNVGDLSGVAAHVSKPLTIRYGIVLRAEFVQAGGVSAAEPAGEKQVHPQRNLYFKVLPSGSSNMDGGILGYPTLDSAPHGLGHRREDTTHVFTALNVALPRLELSRREESQRAQAKYAESGDGSVCWMNEGPRTQNGGQERARCLTERCCRLQEGNGQPRRLSELLAAVPCACMGLRLL